MPLIATGFTRLLGTGIPCGETLLSVTAVFDHVVSLPIGCNYSPALLQVPLKYLREAKQACIFKFSIMDPQLFDSARKCVLHVL